MQGCKIDLYALIFRKSKAWAGIVTYIVADGSTSLDSLRDGFRAFAEWYADFYKTTE